MSERGSHLTLREQGPSEALIFFSDLFIRGIAALALDPDTHELSRTFEQMSSRAERTRARAFPYCLTNIYMYVHMRIYLFIFLHVCKFSRSYQFEPEEAIFFPRARVKLHRLLSRLLPCGRREQKQTGRGDLKQFPPENLQLGKCEEEKKTKKKKEIKKKSPNYIVK